MSNQTSSIPKKYTKYIFILYKSVKQVRIIQIYTQLYLLDNMWTQCTISIIRLVITKVNNTQIQTSASARRSADHHTPYANNIKYHFN